MYLLTKKRAKNKRAIKSEFAELLASFKEIRESYKEIRESNKETAERQKETAESQKETDRAIKETAESQKKTDRQLQETDRQLQETDRQLQETDRQLQETDRQLQETDRQLQETDRQLQETAERQKETAESQKETDRQIKRLNKQMGGLHRRFGDMAAHLVVPGIEKRFNELGYYFNIMLKRGMKVSDEQGNTVAEIDAALENDDYFVAIEIKATVKLNDVAHHIKRLEITRDAMEKIHYKPKKLMGVIAGAIFEPAEQKAVIDAGFFALVQSGDTMKMAIPPDFVPRYW